MSRLVRISTLAPTQPYLAESKTNEQAVDDMVRFWEKQLAKVLPDEPDLILLPEYGDVYQNLPKKRVLEYVDARGDRLSELLSETANKHNCYIAYSHIRVNDDGSRRNVTQILGRDGSTVGCYHKCHPVEGECQDYNILAGHSATVFDCDFGKVGAAICFDLNFDVLREQYKKLKPELLLFSSVYHGGLMQAYWAYSLRCHFASAIGGHWHCPSHIIQPNGRIVASTTNYVRHVTHEINLDSALLHLDFNWPKLDELKTRYGRSISIDDTGHLGSVLLSNNSSERTVQDLIKEAELTLVDDYLERTLGVHAEYREPSRD